jgi:hypothetical protein
LRKYKIQEEDQDYSERKGTEINARNNPVFDVFPIENDHNDHQVDIAQTDDVHGIKPLDPFFHLEISPHF